jgi:hypothetical protein
MNVQIHPEHPEPHFSSKNKLRALLTGTDLTKPPRSPRPLMTGEPSTHPDMRCADQELSLSRLHTRTHGCPTRGALSHNPSGMSTLDIVTLPVL